MLLNGHNLYAVVAVGNDARQHVLAELVVGTHLFGIFAHTDVALIYEQGVFLGAESLFLPLVRSGVPHLSREYLGLVVLYYAAHPGRYSLTLATVPVYAHLVEVAVLHGFRGQLQLPVACSFDAFSLVSLVFLPVVEVADEVYLRSVGCPLAEHPSSCRLVQAEVFVAACKVAERSLAVGSELRNLPQRVFVPTAYGILEWLKPTVVLH